MNDIDKELNKGIGKQNKARSVVIQEYDFSKLERDLDGIVSQNVTLGRVMENVIEILNNNGEITNQQIKIMAKECLTKQQLVQQNDKIISLLSQLVELQQQAVNKKTDIMRGSESFIKLKENIEEMQKNFMNSTEVCSCLAVSKPTALKLMQLLAYDEPLIYAFRRCQGQAPSVIIKRRQVDTKKIRALTADTVTIGRDSIIKKRDITLRSRGSFLKRNKK